MTKKQLLLVLLMEECDELSQRASNAIRFGLEEIQEGQELNNTERILYEFNDLVATLQMIVGENTLIPENIFLKKDKIQKWLEYSRQCGTLTEPVLSPSNDL